MSKNECPFCFGVGHLMVLSLPGCWQKCHVCVGTGTLVVNVAYKLPPLQFSGNSPFPLAKD